MYIFTYNIQLTSILISKSTGVNTIIAMLYSKFDNSSLFSINKFGTRENNIFLGNTHLLSMMAITSNYPNESAIVFTSK